MEKLCHELLLAVHFSGFHWCLWCLKTPNSAWINLFYAFFSLPTSFPRSPSTFVTIKSYCPITLLIRTLSCIHSECFKLIHKLHLYMEKIPQMKYYHTPIRMAKIRRLTIPGVGEELENWNSPHCWWNAKCFHHLEKTLRQLLKMLNMHLPYDPAVPHILSQEMWKRVSIQGLVCECLSLLQLT